MRTPKAPRTQKPQKNRRTPGTAGTAGTPESTHGGGAGTVLDFPAPRASHRVRNLVLWITAVVLVLAGVVAYVLFSPALALRDVRVEGNVLVTAAEVQAELGPLAGVPLTRISSGQVEELLAEQAPIESVDIAAEPPSTLVVTVTERVPVAVLQSGGEFVLIDAEGRQLAGVARREDARLPLIAGGADAVNTAVFSSITAVLAELPASILARLNSASASSVDSIQLSLADDQRIFWGSSERNLQKAEVLEAMLAMPATEPAVREFDVSTPDRPVTR